MSNKVRDKNTDRDCVSADEYNNCDGGSIYPGCLAKQFSIQTGTVAYIKLNDRQILDRFDALLNMDATSPDNPVSFVNTNYLLEQIAQLDDRGLDDQEQKTLNLLKKITAKIDPETINDIQFFC